MQKPRSYFLTVFLSIFLLVSCSKEVTSPNGNPADLTTEHLLLGNPSSATADTTNDLNYLMVKPQYILSYNRDRGTPNWVSWHLNKTWLGSADRQNDFRADISLPSSWYHVQADDYMGSGFDRGHNCPSADRTDTKENNSATFLMSNMIPQAPTNNEETWANLESYCRSLVSKGNEIYIVMGSYGRGGIGSEGRKTTIANGKVTVPSTIWKVILILPEGMDDLSRISTTTRVIAVSTPNSNSVNTSWGGYRTSVDEIQRATGYNLLSNVPTSIQDVLEVKVDTGPTQ